MKRRSKRVYDRPITQYLAMVTDERGRVIMDTIRKSLRPSRKLRLRMDKLRSVEHSVCRGVNFGKRYYWWRHRIGGPAFINTGHDSIEWYVNGVIYVDTRQYCDACGFSMEETITYILKYGDKLPDDLNEL